MTTASRGPHTRMNVGRRRVGLSIVWWSLPPPSLLDSSLRRNDEWGAGMTNVGAGMTNGGAGKTRAGAVVCGHFRGHVRSFSYQPLTPAGAGTPRYEKPESWVGSANWHGGFCHSPPRPQRGTSPSPRVVFDRATFPIPAPLDSGLRRNDEWGAGMTNGGAGKTRAGAVVCGHSRGHVRSFSYQPLTPAGAGTPSYEKPESWVGSANWHGGFCHSPPRPQRGTSPSPRVVFDRTTLALGRLSPISGLTFCRAGLARGFPPARERRLRGLEDFEFTIQGGLSHPGSESGTCFRTNGAPGAFKWCCLSSCPLKELRAEGPAMECGRISGVVAASRAYGVNGSGQG